MLNVKIFVISETILPQVIKSSESAGRLHRDWFDIPAGQIRMQKEIKAFKKFYFFQEPPSVPPWGTFSAVSSQH